jgi:ribonuclease-3
VQIDIAHAEARVGVTFIKKELLAQAFTHRSFLNENRGTGRGHNERLEFLGDAVLELVVTEHLYAVYPHRDEGDLTSYRAAVVNTIVLADTARELGFNELLMLSRGEARDQGRARVSILADAFEAVIGAVYLDQGYGASKEFIARTLLPKLPGIVEEGLWIDAKSRLQEKSQDVLSLTPSYRVVSEEGPDHDKRFVIAAMLGQEEVGRGSGKSKQDAEQEAARAGLKTKNWL